MQDADLQGLDLGVDHLGRQEGHLVASHDRRVHLVLSLAYHPDHHPCHLVDQNLHGLYLLCLSWHQGHLCY